MIITLSTTRPTLLLNENPNRRRIAIQMQPFDVDANNIGTIHIGFGFQPVATVGHASQGEVLLQGSVLSQPSAGEKLEDKHKRAVWATTATTNQTLIVEEEVNGA